MSRLSERRKGTLQKCPWILEVWHRIRPGVIGSLAHDALFILRLLSLCGVGWLIVILFYGWERDILIGVDFVLFLLSLRSIFKHADS